jgi:hypothetical protein
VAQGSKRSSQLLTSRPTKLRRPTPSILLLPERPLRIPVQSKRRLYLQVRIGLAYVETTRGAPFPNSITYPNPPARPTRHSLISCCASGVVHLGLLRPFFRHPLLARSLNPVSLELDCRKHGPATGAIARHAADAGMFRTKHRRHMVIEANHWQLTNLNILVR